MWFYIVTYFGKVTVGKWKLDQMSSSALFLKVSGPKGSLWALENHLFQASHNENVTQQDISVAEKTGYIFASLFAHWLCASLHISVVAFKSIY